MKKLLQWLDDNILKLGISFSILFIALYPKLPSVHIIRTWVYIRLEDFLIAAVVLIWLVQLLRRKVKLPSLVGLPIAIYWIVGLVSLVYTLLFIGPHLVGFFPHLAFLEYFRRIEYMILFFVAFSTIKSAKDIKNYIVILCVTLAGIVFYGFGQKFYLALWAFFPKFFEQFSFCFPSFQTGNEEFAKGIPLCLPSDGRITSTFGGHYDLAAYMVVVLPVLLGIFASVKKIWTKIGIGVLFCSSLMLLIFTASRVSFLAYLLGAIFALFFMKQKKLLIPVIVISIACLFIFSGSTAKRFMETFRVVNVVTNNQGQVVGVAENNLPDALKKKIAKNDSVVVEAPPPSQNLPTGSSFITLPQAKGPATASKTTYVKSALPTDKSLQLKLANGGFEISTVSGSFLIQKALVYDISFTTRFQSEWPNAWAAFMSNPPLGKGYSTITLATDNDYLRLLGESGFLGFSAFILVFLVFAIYLQKTNDTSSGYTRYFVLGLAGGVLGLFANGTLIDVFESSKVAETLWILLGIGAGALSLHVTETIDYVAYLKKILFSHVALIIYVCILVFTVFGGGITNFFVADDFTWLKWAATSTPHILLTNFINANGFFYRPIAKAIMFIMYTFFSFQPQGYHVVDIFLHCAIGIGIYLLGLLVWKKKVWAIVLSAAYLILPIHAETLFWISTISTSFSTLFLVWGMLAYGYSQTKGAKTWYGVALLLGLLALGTYEMGIVFPLVLFLLDTFFFEKHISKKLIVRILPFLLLDVIYVVVRSISHVAPIGGDYSYNIIHIIPNVFGNYINYFLTTFIGEKMLGWQNTLRASVKQYSFVMSGLIVMIIVIGLALLKRFKTVFGYTVVSEVVFGLLLSFAALLPFLGLGNITERYGYFAAFGFIFAAVAIAKGIVERNTNKVYVKGVVIAIALAFLLYAKSAVNFELAQWMKASTITYNTLAYFRVVQENLPGGSTIYISNIPTRYGNAWIFPVGFEDGLWFIYRDPFLKVIKTKSVDESLSIKMPHEGIIRAKEYVFDFDKNGQVLQY